MADKNVELIVSVQTKQAEQNVDNLNKKLDQTKQKTDNVNAATSKGASSIESWGTAFEKVLDEASKGTGSLGGSLGGITTTLKTALPIIKNINSTAITGLKAIKSGLSATGLGLVVVALGEILSHWKEIVDWTRKAVTGAEEYKLVLAGVESTVVTTGEAFNRINDTMKEVQQKHADDLRVYQAEGHTAREILEFRKKQNEEEKKAFENTVRNNAAWIRNNKGNQAAVDQTLQAYRNISIELDHQIEVEKRIEAVRKDRKDSGNTPAKEVKETTQATLDLWGVLKKLKEEKAGGGYFDWLLNPDTSNVLGTELIEMIRLFGQGLGKFQNEWIKGAIDGNEHMLDLEEAFSKEYIARIEKGAYQEIQTEEEKAAAIEDVERRLWGLRMQVAMDNLELAKQIGDNAQIQKYTDDLKVLNAQLETYVAEDTSWLTVLASLDERQDELIQNLIAGLEESKASWRDYVKDLSEVGANVGSIFDSMVEAQKNQIEMDQKLGKISEEEAKKRFQQLKGYEIAANWINTLAGVANVVASPEGRAGVLGWAIQATQIAAIIAAGIARDRQIRNSYIDNPDMGGSGNAGMAGATPLQVVSDITPSPTMNIPVSSEDTRVYILESDIQKSNNRVKVREDNTTW